MSAANSQLTHVTDRETVVVVFNYLLVTQCYTEDNNGLADKTSTEPGLERLRDGRLRPDFSCLLLLFLLIYRMPEGENGCLYLYNVINRL